MKNLFIILLGLLAIVTGWQLFCRDVDVKAAVMAVCGASNKTINGDLEQACGDVQKVTHTEFLCDANTLNANCWVEVK